MSNDNNIYSPPNPQESLLEAALRYDQLGYRVIPTTANKSPACGEGWNKPDWRQDEETLNNLFSNDRVAGIAIVLYPTTDLISIDFDGPHSTTLWQSPIRLDDVCRHTTPHGGHILFKVSEKFREFSKSFERKVRLIKAGEDCQCAKGKCGIDFLLNGYVIVPPTPGYIDKVSIGNVTELPDTILKSILQKLEEKETNPSNQTEKFDIDAALAGVEEGQRGETLFRYASSLRARGTSKEEALILVKTAADNCHPPYKEKPEKLVEDVYKRYSGPAEAINPEDFGIESFTDHGNAMRIVKKYGDIMHWTKGFGWMVYDGHWILHETATSNVYQFATSALLDIKKEVARIPATMDRNEAKSIKIEILKHAQKSESTALREQALAQVKHHATIAISENAFDKNPWLLNVSNGTLNLKMFEFYSHRREDLLTKMANVEYDEDAQCPRWGEFIALIMDGNEKLTRFLQKAVGYSLTGSVQEKCLFICYGGSGENGKSTFVNAINDLLGKYAKPTRIQTFLEKNNESSNDIAALGGARFVSSIEVKETRRFDEALVKQLTGGDPVTARFLFKEFFEYYPQFKIWLAVNNKPQFDATDRDRKSVV